MQDLKLVHPADYNNLSLPYLHYGRVCILLGIEELDISEQLTKPFKEIPIPSEQERRTNCNPTRMWMRNEAASGVGYSLEHGSGLGEVDY